MKQGSRLLQVTGILNIIGGGIMVILILVTFVLAGALAGALGGAAAVGVVFIAFITSIIGSVAQLVAGILGVKNWKTPSKAMICIIFGLICVVFSLVSVITTAMTEGFNFFSFLLGLVLPVLYLVGAFQLKGMAGQVQQPGPAPYNPGAVPPPPPVEQAPPPPPSNEA